MFIKLCAAEIGFLNSFTVHISTIQFCIFKIDTPYICIC